MYSEVYDCLAKLPFFTFTILKNFQTLSNHFKVIKIKIPETVSFYPDSVFLSPLAVRARSNNKELFKNRKFIPCR